MTEPPDLHTLTGAYAVDALPEDERAAFEAHLEACAACAQEVAELQATAARLSASAYELPPPALRGRVLAAIADTPQERAGAGDDAGQPASGRGWPRWVATLALPAAAALLVAVVGLGVLVNDLNGRLDQLETASTQMNDLLAAPDAVTISASGPSGGMARVVASPGRGEAMFIAADMEPAPHGHTYELWVIEDGPIPAGLFDVDDRGRATRMLTGDLANAAAIAVTVEPEGGSPTPTSDPVMVLELGT